MLQTQRRRARALFAAAAAITAVGAFAAPASAGVLVKTTEACDWPELVQPFERWGDHRDYGLAPDGGFEDGAHGWTLRGGAAVVSDNERFHVRSADDTKSLRIPAGGTAISPPFCVGFEHPMMRLFTRYRGLLSTIAVTALVETSLGVVVPVPVTVGLPTFNWQPTLPLPLLALAGVTPLVPGQHTPIRLKFTTLGLGGEWKIDDVYIDPSRMR